MVVKICRRNKSPIRGLFLDRNIAEPNELIDIDMIKHSGFANEIYRYMQWYSILEVFSSREATCLILNEFLLKGVHSMLLAEQVFACPSFLSQRETADSGRSTRPEVGLGDSMGDQVSRVVGFGLSVSPDLGTVEA